MSSELFDSGHSFSDKNTREEILDQISHGESSKNNCKNLQQLFHHQNADFGGKIAKVFLKNVRMGVVNIILKIWEKSCGILMKQPVLFSLLLLHPFPSTHPNAQSSKHGTRFDNTHWLHIKATRKIE